MLKTFLSLSGPDAATERRRLAPVLCQILHLTVEERKNIQAAWRLPEDLGLRARLGTLVGGWLHAPVAETVSSGSSSGSDSGTDKEAAAVSNVVASDSVVVGGNENHILPFS